MCELQNNIQRTFSLKEISEWNTKGSLVTIPALQRGLVWKPKQVELLWDSILRGFPIGSFMLSSIKNNGYYLLDGQQRFNAISLGFIENTKNAKLWVDLFPNRSLKSTRVFWVRVTTLAHPWGYETNDACDILKYADRRQQQMSKGEKVHYPFKSKFAIPLSELIDYSSRNESHFIEKTKESIKKDHTNISDDEEKAIIENLKELYSRLYKVIKTYRVSINILEHDVLERESNLTDIDNMEILFDRLNSLGTQISPQDRIYSAIKAYWGDDFRDVIDKLALNYMPSAMLAQLVFRLALTNHTLLENEKIEFTKEINIVKIRDLAKCEDEEQKGIKSLYENENKNNLEILLETINGWIKYDKDKNKNGLPPVLLTSVARKSSNVFLLLLYLAQKNPSNIHQDIYIGMTLYLHWFSKKNLQESACNCVLKMCINDVSLENIQRGIELALNQGYIYQIYNNLNFKLIDSITKEWRFWNTYQKEPWYNLWEKIHQNHELLLYVQRNYLCEKFADYNPARQDLWEDHNRPWDIDHIIPSIWFDYNRSDWRDCCKSIQNYIGNKAAIAFDVNRAKGAKAEWEEYLNSNELFFDEIKTFIYNNEILTDKRKFLNNADKVTNFINAILVRTYSLWKNFYNVLDSSQLLNFEKILEKDIRFNFFKILRDKLDEDWKMYYTEGLSQYEYPLKKQADIHSEYATQYITSGKQINDDLMIAVTVNYIEKKRMRVCYGLKKLPDMPNTVSNTIIDSISKKGYSENPWWYLKKDMELKNNIDDIIEELKELEKKLKELLGKKN